MPVKRGRTCKHPGCLNIAYRSDYCEKHKPKKVDRRPNANQRGYDYKWQQFSKDFLMRHKWCKHCGKRAKVTDHIIGYEEMVRLYGGNTYKDEDYQPLCVSCNTKKGKRDC